MWFLFQDVLIYTPINIINNAGYPVLQSMQKVSSLFIVQFKYKYGDLTGVWIQYTNYNKHAHFHISKTVLKDIILVFIKGAAFLHVGLSLMIQAKDKIKFAVDSLFSRCFKDGQLYNTKIRPNLHGPVYEYFFVTA